MSKPKGTSRRKSRTFRASVNRADYDLPPSPKWTAPTWLLAFARDEIWPFLNSRPKAELDAALNRWLDSHAKTDEYVRQLNALDVEVRRLSCLADTEAAQQQINNLIATRMAGLTRAYHEAPLDWPLPPPTDRIVPHGPSLVVLMAVHDETLAPKHAIGPSNVSLYTVLRNHVRELKKKHLPGLKTILTTAKRTPPPPISVDEEDVNILRGLHKQAPRRLTRTQLEGHSSVSRKTISLRLPALLDRGWVDMPAGPNGGIAISAAGVRILTQIDGAKDTQ